MKVLIIRRNQFHCDHLIALILAIYLLPQIDTICESYRTLTILPNTEKVKQVNSKKKVNDDVMLTWQRDTWLNLHWHVADNNRYRWQEQLLTG